MTVPNVMVRCDLEGIDNTTSASERPPDKNNQHKYKCMRARRNRRAEAMMP